jgi:hypothetical protein
MKITARAAALALVCGAAVLWPLPSSAENVSVPTLKAAFLMNFVKFAEWPDGAVSRRGVFTFCVGGDKAVQQALEVGVRRQASLEAMNVKSVTLQGPFTDCQLLYLGGFDVRHVRTMVQSIDGAAIFTVSDVEGFSEAGGIVQLRLENGRMRFAINSAAASRAHIALSAKLLSLATLVKDGY